MKEGGPGQDAIVSQCESLGNNRGQQQNKKCKPANHASSLAESRLVEN